MYLMGIEVTFHCYYLESLKEKRRIVKSIVDQVRSRYKISAAEIGYLDNLDQGSIGFGIVSNNRKHSEKVLQTVINHMDIRSEIEIINIDWVEV